MIDSLILMLELPFLQRALLIGTLVAVPMAVLSAFVVLRGWSLMGDAISHSILPGIVLSYAAGLPLLPGAFAAGMICALGTGYLKQNSRVKEDTVMGVVFSGMFGLGILLYTSIESDIHLDHILFGNMLGIGTDDILVSGSVAAAICAFVLMRYRDLVVEVFDPTHGRSIGLPMSVMHYALLAMITLVVIAALSAVGLILSIALLISPAAIALLWVRQLHLVIAVATGVTLVSVWTGIYLSVLVDAAPEPSIVLVLTTLFIASFLRNAGLRKRI